MTHEVQAGDNGRPTQLQIPEDFNSRKIVPIGNLATNELLAPSPGNVSLDGTPYSSLNNSTIEYIINMQARNAALKQKENDRNDENVHEAAPCCVIL